MDDILAPASVSGGSGHSEKELLSWFPSSKHIPSYTRHTLGNNRRDTQCLNTEGCLAFCQKNKSKTPPSIWGQALVSNPPAILLGSCHFQFTDEEAAPRRGW